MTGGQHNQAEFDKYAEHYHAHIDHIGRRLVDPRGDYFTRLKSQELRSVIAEQGLTMSDLTVVDVGCGTGDFECQLSPDFARIFSFDRSPVMAQVADRREHQAQVFCADARHVPLSDGVADVVFSSCLLHHMPTDSMARSFSEMHRICRSGGHVLVFEHNPFNPITQVVVRTTPLDRDSILRSPSTIGRALEDAGFSIVFCHYFLFGPAVMDSRLRVLRKWLRRLPLGGQFLVVAQKPSTPAAPSRCISSLSTPL